jgi:hypothetical protein
MGLTFSDVGEEERAQSLEELNRFAERLSSIPLEARSLLELIVARGEETPSHEMWSAWCGEFEIPVNVLKSIADCTAAELRQHIEVLEHFDLLYLETERPETAPLYIVGNAIPGLGWPLLREFRKVYSDHLGWRPA